VSNPQTNGVFPGHLRSTERHLTRASFVVGYEAERERKGRNIPGNIPGGYHARHDPTLHQPLFLIADPIKIPAWKRLASPTITTDERISLITGIFSDHKEIELVRNLCGDDAQTFIDLVDEVRCYPLSPLKHEWADPHLCPVG